MICKLIAGNILKWARAHLLTVKWFKVLLYNTKIQFNICLHKVQGLSSSIWPINGTQKVQPLWVRVELGVMATRVFHIFQILTGTSPSDVLV